MAVTITTVLAPATGGSVAIYDVAASADADVTATIPHGLGLTPLEVHVCPLLVNHYGKAWRVTTINGTNVVLSGTNAAGSGTANPQTRVVIKRPHTIDR